MSHQRSKWLLLAAFGAGLFALSIGGCEGESLVESCENDFLPPEVAPAVENPDAYFSSVKRPSDTGRFLVEMVRSTPVPKYTGLYTWTLRVEDADCEPLKKVEVKAEPTMPQHNHGTYPIYTEATADTSGQFTLSEMDLFMGGVWQVEITITDTSGEADTVSWFFDLEG